MLNSRLEARLSKLQSLLVVLYAASLPLSLTASWVILSAGLALWALQAALAVCAPAPATNGHAGAVPVETPRPASQSPTDVLKQYWQAPPLTVPIVAFAAALTLSGLANRGLAEAFLSLNTLRALLVYFWAYQVFAAESKALTASLKVLVITAAVAGLWGAVQQIFNFHPFGYPYLQGTGFLGGPMAFAGQMQIFALLALGIFLGNGYRNFGTFLSRPLVFGTVAFANLCGVIFASERSAWLGAIAGILALGSALSPRALVKCVLALVVVSLVAWITIPVVQTRLAGLADWRQDVSTRVRFQIWQESIQVWRASPVFGVGILRYPHFDIPEAIVPGYSRDLNHAHSNYIHILTTSGIVGLTAYLWLFFASASTAWRISRSAGGNDHAVPERALALGILGGIVALGVSGVFEYNFGASQMRLAQWFVLAMLVNKQK